MPNDDTIEDFSFIRLVPKGDTVVVIYKGRRQGAKGFRNTEVLIVRDGKIVEPEVYFGWSIPRDARPGGFVNPAA